MSRWGLRVLASQDSINPTIVRRSRALNALCGCRCLCCRRSATKLLDLSPKPLVFTCEAIVLVSKLVPGFKDGLEPIIRDSVTRFDTLI